MGAIVWNLLTWFLGIPSSSSHALVGGLVGAGVAAGGFSAVVAWGVIKTAVFIFLAPIFGMLMAILLVIVTSWLFKPVSATTSDRVFRRLQLVSAAAYSLGHGANDAQKTMGIIMALLVSQGLLGAQDGVPFWVVISCQVAMGLGTLYGRLADRPHHGLEDHPPDAAPGLLRGDGRRLHAVRRDRRSAFRSRPRTRSPARSWASARRGAPRRCAGASPATSSSPGS